MNTMSEVKININVEALPAPETETEELVCDHCKIPHPCTAEYGKQYADKPWWCGLCYLAYLGGPPMKTACPDHEVPPFERK